MKIRRRSKTLAAGTTVALATAGLSSCNDNGAVDPPPPPLECNTVDNGETLTATATVTGRELRITIRNASFSIWAIVAVTSVGGGTARPLHPAEPLVVVIDLEDGVTGGTFTLSGVLQGSNGERCGVTRRFTFTIGSGGAVVASADELRCRRDSRRTSPCWPATATTWTWRRRRLSAGPTPSPGP